MALYGGAELVVVRLAKYLQSHNHKVTILAGSTSPHTEYKDLEIITPTPQAPWQIWSTKTLLSIYRVYRSLQKESERIAKNYDVINVHNFPAIWSAPRHNKIVWMCNEVPNLWHNHYQSPLLTPAITVGKIIDRTIIRCKSPIAVVADSTNAQFFELRYGLAAYIIPYGIDYEFYSQTIRRNTTQFTIIQPAMISASKNQLAVLEMLTTVEDARVIFAGYKEDSGSYMQLLQKCITEHQLQDRVTFTGNVSREKLRELYGEADVAVFPGRGQGSWLGPFEALSAGVPVVVSPNLTCADLVKREEIGLVTNDLVAGINRVHYNKTETQKAQKYIRQNLTWDKFCGGLEELMLR